MTEWLLQTIPIPNWVVIVYWLSLSVPLIVMFILEIKYYAIKYEREAKRRLENERRTKTDETHKSSLPE